jgi:hypothetical protein
MLAHLILSDVAIWLVGFCAALLAGMIYSRGKAHH